MVEIVQHAFPWIVASLVVALLFCEYRSFRMGRVACKTTASLGFVALGVLTKSREGLSTWVLIGLVLGCIGDLFLLATRKKLFICGIATFLLGHVAYIFAFVSMGVSASRLEAMFLMTGVVGLAFLSWLWPHAAKLRGAVVAYVVTISLMLCFAVATQRMLAGVAAALFYFSDMAVARERFVKKSFSNKLWGLPFYYTAQVMLAMNLLH